MPLLQLHGPLEAGKWVELRFPLTKFAGQYLGTQDSGFDASELAAIVLVQGLDDRQQHELFIDDVRVVDSAAAADSQPPAAPVGLSVEPAERHCDLAWRAGDDREVLAYRVYRSWDGQVFEPVATRPGYSTRAVDFAGPPGKTAHYKVSAIDAQNHESPLSAPVTAKTQPFDDEQLLDMVQRGCFRFYWEGANQPSGMALEILPGDQDLVAVGGSGFGIMAQIVATERRFITRAQSTERMLRIVRFLDKADRFHGAWPHFLDGNSGRVNPYFGTYDDGGDLVETAFLIQGLLAARQYYSADTAEEREIRDTIARLWHGVEWDWYRKTPDSPVLYWHWSPEHAWHISHPLIGWNETMIAYLLAIASPTHGVPASLWHTGWAGQAEQAVTYRRNWSRTAEGDHFTNGNRYYGITLEVGSGTGGDLFFTQFSNLGFDPRGKRDRYTNYFRNNRNLTLINRAYCIDNPLGRKGYGPDCWGRSAGINSGGGKPNPRDDNGTICCSAALGCMPYTPQESMEVLKHLYRDLGASVWGVYGFHDGFNETEHWFDEVYMGLNQAQIVVGIENHRTGLLWKLFMANPEIAPALEAIGFTPDSDADESGRLQSH
jgi:exo beta-1,2-glucooligosaccharide sophorohydrolase (non-reducing end)